MRKLWSNLDWRSLTWDDDLTPSNFMSSVILWRAFLSSLDPLSSVHVEFRRNWSLPIHRSIEDKNQPWLSGIFQKSGVVLDIFDWYGIINYPIMDGGSADFFVSSRFQPQKATRYPYRTHHSPYKSYEERPNRQNKKQRSASQKTRRRKGNNGKNGSGLAVDRVSIVAKMH